MLGLVLVLAAPSSAQWYARGGYYSDWAADTGNVLNDDGIDGDATAGDGIFSRDVTSTVTVGGQEFKIAEEDWDPNYPLSNVPITLTEDFQVIHFTFDTNTYDDDWFPSTNIVWSDALTPGTTWGLAGDAPEFGVWDPAAGPQATINEDGMWEVIVYFAAAGDYEYKWTANMLWDVQQFGIDGYGTGPGTVFVNVLEPGEYKFLLDPAVGRGWHGFLEPTPASESTWGGIKALYRLA